MGLWIAAFTVMCLVTPSHGESLRDFERFERNFVEVQDSAKVCEDKEWWCSTAHCYNKENWDKCCQSCKGVPEPPPKPKKCESDKIRGCDEATRLGDCNTYAWEHCCATCQELEKKTKECKDGSGCREITKASKCQQYGGKWTNSRRSCCKTCEKLLTPTTIPPSTTSPPTTPAPVDKEWWCSTAHCYVKENWDKCPQSCKDVPERKN
jgi:hypothetical protein